MDEQPVARGRMDGATDHKENYKNHLDFLEKKVFDCKFFFIFFKKTKVIE